MPKINVTEIQVKEAIFVVEGHVRVKLVTGQTFDLSGMTDREARFFEDEVRQGQRYMFIITGPGKGIVKKRPL